MLVVWVLLSTEEESVLISNVWPAADAMELMTGPAIPPTIDMMAQAVMLAFVGLEGSL